MSHSQLPHRYRFLNAANVISVSRIALTAGISWAIFTQPGAVVLVFFALVVASDLVDGYVARRTHQTSRFGTLLDHGADALFVVTVTGIYAHFGVLPPLLPIVIAVAFIQYVLDSHAFSDGTLRASVLGRCNGVAYFVIAGCAVAAHHYLNSNAATLAVLTVAAWLLVATTIVSMAQRLMYVLRRRR